jgi:hypothetical protein
MAPLREEISGLRVENQNLAGQLQSRQNPEPTPPTEDEFLNQFAADPKGSIARAVKEAVGTEFQNLAPILTTHNEVASQGLVEAQRASIDNQFGRGTFEEVVHPLLAKIMDDTRKVDPASLAKPDWIQTQVNSIKGFKMDELIERKTNFQTSTQEAQNQQIDQIAQRARQVAGLTGGQKITGSEDDIKTRELSDEEKAFAASVQAGGQSVDIVNLRRSGQTGNTLDDWRASRDAAKLADKES